MKNETPEEFRKRMGMSDNAIEYLESKQKEIIDRILDLAQNGKNEESVKLKANVTLLNKLVPDRTKMEVDLKSVAPYDMLKAALENASLENKGG